MSYYTANDCGVAEPAATAPSAAGSGQPPGADRDSDRPIGIRDLDRVPARYRDADRPFLATPERKRSS